MGISTQALPEEGQSSGWAWWQHHSLFYFARKNWLYWHQSSSAQWLLALSLSLSFHTQLSTLLTPFFMEELILVPRWIILSEGFFQRLCFVSWEGESCLPRQAVLHSGMAMGQNPQWGWVLRSERPSDNVVWAHSPFFSWEVKWGQWWNFNPSTWHTLVTLLCSPVRYIKINSLKQNKMKTLELQAHNLHSKCSVATCGCCNEQHRTNLPILTESSIGQCQPTEQGWLRYRLTGLLWKLNKMWCVKCLD